MTTSRLSRRSLLLSTAAVAVTGGLRQHAVALSPFAGDVLTRPPAPLRAQPTGAYELEAAERVVALPCFGGSGLPLWTFTSQSTQPVIRLKKGQPFDVVVKNALPTADEIITIHWHGLRIPNREDGVPYLTQTPIGRGQQGRYTFTPPETGTFFFHTHCNSVEHFGRGLFGAMIVEGDEVVPSDADVVLMMKDWRLDAAGSFLPFTTDEGASRSGTNGTVRAINGVREPVYAVPSSGNVRLRLLNVDPTRISEIGFEGADAAIIAIDGNGCQPIELGSWRIGPASRLDILMRAPKSGQRATLYDYFSAEPVPLAHFVAQGPDVRRDKFVPVALKTNLHPVVDHALSERINLTFMATATGASVAAISDGESLPIGKLCLSKRTFWAINKQAWSSVDHSDLGPPLARLVLGRNYIIELSNITPNAHPIHIHGHTFEVLKSNLRSLPRYRADTVLLLPKERLEIALTANNAGLWMVHCHILEHQETGMMGYMTVA